MIELFTAFSPNFTVFLILRALFGVGTGGEWGLGASLAMETLPAKARGLFSGILQQGYAFGFLLAAIVYWLVFPHFGWRGLFVAGAIPALLVLFIRTKVPESPAWQRQKTSLAAKISRPFSQTVREHWRLFLYAILLMTAFNCMSHGTQDLYPTFLQKQCGLDVAQVRNVSIIYSLGAIVGGTIFGALSQRWGRRHTIIVAAGLGMLLIPAWMFSPSLGLLIAGGFCMQFMVQGAWGVVPAHLNELSPPELRGTFPGFAYQLGNLFASANATLQAGFAQDHGGNYALALATVAALAAVAIALLTSENSSRGVIHCFTSGEKLADFVLEHGFFISFSGIVTFNSGLFLSPQVECTRGKCAFPAADIYRREVNLAYPVIKRLDPHAQVIIGELAPIAMASPMTRVELTRDSMINRRFR